ncbi:MAG: methyltransferase [Bacteroidia bacterium]|nr:methyltransferase [Bacteroidia bacterium]
MSVASFAFKQFVVKQDRSAMKVGTDAVLLGSWADVCGALHVLDIGTGTGVIALMLAQRSEASIDAIDIDEISCREAEENVRSSRWDSRISVRHTSFQDFAKKEQRRFDLIVSNPPYFSRSSKASFLGRTLARHTDLLPFEELVAGVSLLLRDCGRFCLILPQKEAALFRDIAVLHKLYLTRVTRVRTTPEKATEKRWLMQFQKKPTCFKEDLLVIEQGGRHSYSEEYRNLTRDFYLAF